MENIKKLKCPNCGSSDWRRNPYYRYGAYCVCCLKHISLEEYNISFDLK